MGIYNHNVQIGSIEGQVVVPSVPNDYVSLLLCRSQDSFVIYTRVDYDPIVDVGLVLFPFLNGALVFLKVFVGSESLACLLAQIAIGHRMPYNNYVQAFRLQDF